MADSAARQLSFMLPAMPNFCQGGKAMAVTMVSRWKGKGDYATLLKEETPFLRKYGAMSIRCGHCFAGSYVGEIVCATTFPDWITYARAIEALVTDADYMRVHGEFAEQFEVTDRSIIMDEEY